MRTFNVTVDGQTYEVGVEEVGAAAPQAAPTPQANPAPAAAPKKAAPAPAAAPKAQPTGGDNEILSPLPGTILRINVTPGQAVKAGEVLLVLEAMKMENDIPAPADGVVGNINVAVGATVQSGDLLLTI